MIPEATVDQVLKAVNIADYIGQYVQLRKTGQNLFGLCPFHEEHTPSFSVNEPKQIFHCFSCGRGGNVFKFVMDYDNATFPEAVKKVADFAGIPLDVQVGQAAPVDPEVAKQQHILQDTADLYHHILVNTEKGEAALAYLHKRGLTDETIEEFQLGYAPEERNLLVAFLNNRHVEYQDQRASGLFVEDQAGKLFDRFNDRVMFPLTDANGKVVGFSGRILQSDKSQAKYLNSPETKLFNKRDILFNLHRAKAEFGRDGGPILFEGYMDVIAAYQAGVKTGIASMGTSLTTEQVDIISHLSKRLTVCYDGDEPGQKAIERAVTMLADHPRLQTDVVVLPDGMDPDEYIRARGAEAFQAQVKSVLTPTAFMLQFLARGVDMHNDQAKLTYLNAALRIIGKISDPVARAVYVKQLAETTEVPIAALNQSLPSPQTRRPAAAQPPVADQPVRPLDRYTAAQRQLLYYVWHDDLVMQRLKNATFVFPTPYFQTLFTGWLRFLHEQPDGELAGFLDRVDPELSGVAADVAMQSLPEASEATIDELIQTITSASTVSRLQAIKQAITEAQRLGDKQKQGELTVQYVNLMKLLKQQQG